VPLCPSLVAVTVALPAVTLLSRPLPLTDATAGLLEAHVTGRPVRAFPLASLRVAASCCVVPAV